MIIQAIYSPTHMKCITNPDTVEFMETYHGNSWLSLEQKSISLIVETSDGISTDKLKKHYENIVDAMSYNDPTIVYTIDLTKVE